MQDLKTLLDFHQSRLQQWAQAPETLSESVLQGWGPIEANHAYNFLLWRTEDRARRDDKGADYVYHAKRDIDRFNQARNNQMEAIDSWLIECLAPAAIDSGCPVHSETPGMIIDRLSILTLKHFHMGLQVQRTDVDAAHHAQCQEKCHILAKQRAVLFNCLLALLEEVQAKRKTFAVYRQFKMYNDAKLNPELYCAR